MTQPTFGAASFSGAPGPNPQDAFDLVTGEQLQNAVAQFPERSFLVDENVQAVADRINGQGLTQVGRDLQVAPYVGKWIIVAFTLADHVSRFGMEIVHAQRPADDRVPVRYGLTCIFETEPWSEKLASLPVGTAVTVRGEIEQLNAYEIRLRHCELA